ncbi:LacI family DNA-binding transcriptional regulator [Cryobacterium sp. PH31-L1]|uniref:LacI family DNA-binding transcriptional regulator n=1 Tax=Cryobacterium sp. PH31-L1 TaxID=3046199 RepID=UPI0024BBC385|nr:LacI family DNA-binding transcriptional regulator [Cryobacterium sp. PH31-L1]MDJ0377470.1 LacI family DNA-binding transcriptional regulator [Cryobacterium sp. PH31-L1]
MRLPTVEDVARTARVSRQTVSNVINTPARVKPATLLRVQAAIRELDYRPNQSARRLRQQKSATIGIRLDPQLNGISGAVLDRFLHSLTEQATERGLRVLLFTAATPTEEIDQIRALRDGADVDAFVLTATFDHDPRPEWLIEQKIPFVTFGRPWGIDDLNDPQHRWVDVDGRRGVYAATLSLLDAGAERVAWIGWPPPTATGDDRRSGWEDAMRERLGLGDAELASLCTEVVDDVAEATNAVANVLAGAVLPDGMVCASDTLALGALIAASTAGRRDIPIIGFDDTPVAAALGISSVEQRLDQVAAGALALLLGPVGDSVVASGALDVAHRLIEPALVLRRPQDLPMFNPSRIDGTAAADKH